MRSFLFKNLAAKVLALCLTLILFVLVREDRVKEYDLEIPVATAGVPEDRVVTEGPPDSVRLRLRGRWSDILAAVEKRAIPYTLDMRGRNDGDLIVIDPDQILSDLGVKGLVVLHVTPPAVRVHMQVKATRTVPVRPNLVKAPARGYRVADAGFRITPAEVKLIGTDEAVAGIDELLTTPIDLSGLDKSLRTDVRLAVPPVSSFLRAEPDVVTVEIPIDTVPGTATLEDVAIQVRRCNPAMLCKVAPERTDVRLEGALLAVEQLGRTGVAPAVFVDAALLSDVPGVYPDCRVQVQATGDIVMRPLTPSAALSVEPRPLAPPPAADAAGAPPDVQPGPGP